MYSYYNNGRFSFPPNFDFNIIPGKDNPANVISVIGEGDLHSIINKMSMFENLASASMKPMNIIPTFKNDFSSDLCSTYLTGYYCEKPKVVFIHLRSLNDSDLILHKMKSSDGTKLPENEFDKEDAVYVKLVLYLFLLSDFVLVNVIGMSLDPFYVCLFSEVNLFRKKFKSMSENELKTVSNSIEITNNGRLVQTRLLFVFNIPKCPLITALKQNPKSLLTFRDNIQDKLYAVLKYHNIIGSEYALAKVQTFSPFVFVRLPTPTFAESFESLLNNFDNDDSSIDIIDEEEDKEDRYFENFILNQIHAFNVSKDTSGREYNESISCRNWFKACHKLYNLFSTDKLRFTEQMSNHRYSFFKKGCEVALSVAEGNYKDGLPTQYSRDVHCDKTKAARQVMLTVAKGPGLLDCIKRLEQNLSKVWAVGRQICEAISVTGQRCKHEVHLLPDSDNGTGDWGSSGPDTRKTSFENQCTEEGGSALFSNDVDSLQSGGADQQQKRTGGEHKHLPRMRHCSEVQLISACNCGRRQGTRRDPFDYREANNTFYDEMAESCCFRFTRVALPENTIHLSDDTAKDRVARPSPRATETVTVTTIVARRLRTDEDEEEELSDQSERAYECGSGDLSLSQEQGALVPRRGRHANQSVSSSTFQHDGEEEEEDDDDDDGDEDEDAEGDLSHRSELVEMPVGGDGAPRSPARPIVKTLFQGMFVSDSGVGTAPRHSSWALTDSGPYFSYTHATGLEYNGFVHGSNFLLPWDVPLKTRINKVRKQRVKRAFAAGNFVKAFLGYEMECPVGHRFFLAGPSNMMQGSMASHQVKDAVHGLLTMDIPLYFPCQCSKYLAQLMRIYVAVPNSNLLRVFLQPRVRPGPAGQTPVFTPGGNQPLELEAGHLWVLRLPFAYEHEGHIYRQQADMSVIEECKVLKESIFYEEVSDAEE